MRIGILGALALTALADRRVDGGCCSAARRLGCVIAALSSLAPDLVALGVAQTLVRGLATAGGVLVVVVAAEEMPAGSRAFAITLIGAAGAFGAGLCLMVLPLADLGEGGWRVVMLASLLLLPARPARRPPPPREPPLRRRARRRARWRATAVASGSSARPRSSSSCSPRRRRS